MWEPTCIKGYIPLRMSVVITSVKPTSAFGCGCAGQCPTHDPTPWRSVVNGSRHAKHDHSTHVHERPTPNFGALARRHARDRTSGLLCRPHKWVARRRAGSTALRLHRRQSQMDQHQRQRGHAVRRLHVVNAGACNDRTVCGFRRHGQRRPLRGVHHGLRRERMSAAFGCIARSSRATLASRLCAPRCGARPHACGLERPRTSRLG